MFCLSQTSGYAILALGCMHEPECAWVKSSEIARCTQIPPAYLAKLLHKLSRSGLIVAKRGIFGGYALSRSAGDISLLDVIETLEGVRVEPMCLLGLSQCSEGDPCPAHAFWQPQRNRIQRELRQMTLKTVTEFASADACLAPGPCACDTDANGRRSKD